VNHKRSRGAPLVTVAAPRNVNGFPTRDFQSSTETLAAVQAAYVAARFRLDGVRAKLTAELAWGAR